MRVRIELSVGGASYTVTRESDEVRTLQGDLLTSAAVFFDSAVDAMRRAAELQPHTQEETTDE